MDVQMSGEQMEQLAGAIAMAQLSAPDQAVEKMIENWPDEFRTRIPAISAAAKNGQPVSAMERYNVARGLQPAAERAILKAQAAKVANDERVKAIREKRAAEVASELERHQMSYDVAIAHWKAEAHAARSAGRPVPPQPPEPPRTENDLIALNRPRFL